MDFEAMLFVNQIINMLETHNVTIRLTTITIVSTLLFTNFSFTLKLLKFK